MLSVTTKSKEKNSCIPKDLYSFIIIKVDPKWDEILNFYIKDKEIIGTVQRLNFFCVIPRIS